MRRIQFERLAQLVAISAINKDARVITELCIKEQSLQVCFSDYVKSQIHLNIVEDLYGRGIAEYAKAMYFLKGKQAYRSYALKVLRYFYEDMSRFLINNAHNINLDVVVDFPLEEVSVDLIGAKSEYLDVVNGTHERVVPDAIRTFKYDFILDEVSNYEDAVGKADSYVLAAILHEFSTMEPISKIRIER